MNERIRELAEQAGFYVSYDDKIYIPTTSEEITDCQTKFAELIVQECVGLCMNVNGDLPRTEPLVAASIRKYFGVKE